LCSLLLRFSGLRQHIIPMSIQQADSCRLQCNGLCRYRYSEPMRADCCYSATDYAHTDTSSRFVQITATFQQIRATDYADTDTASRFMQTAATMQQIMPILIQRPDSCRLMLRFNGSGDTKTTDEWASVSWVHILEPVPPTIFLSTHKFELFCMKA
jgi:hypothetical protein